MQENTSSMLYFKSVWTEIRGKNTVQNNHTLSSVFVYYTDLLKQVRFDFKSGICPLWTKSQHFKCGQQAALWFFKLSLHIIHFQHESILSGNTFPWIGPVTIVGKHR